MSSLRLCLAQINPTVGDLEGNRRLIEEAMTEAKGHGADLVVFPELAICGYPPEDLLIRPGFLRRSQETVNALTAADDVAALVGAPVTQEGKLLNGAALLSDGEWKTTIFKTELPNYGVFDERRYFEPGANETLIKLGDLLVGVTICEDLWVDNGLAKKLVDAGAQLLVNLSASPFRVGVHDKRIEMVSRLANENGVPFAYVNLTGGQDELVFDGGSFVCDSQGEVIHQAPRFASSLPVVDIAILEETRVSASDSAFQNILDVGPLKTGQAALQDDRSAKAPPGDLELIYTALVTGVRDYVVKNGFGDVVVALSGGIDSALTVAIAADALGASRVHAVAMPSPWSSKGSITDSEKLSANLGVDLQTLPIEPVMQGFDTTLETPFAGTEPGLAEENIQARIRGALIMALSNKFGYLVLTTGNKSEIAVGYCTLYGDMAGGFAVIKDVFKTKVYELCRWRNQKEGKEIIPTAIIDKPPSAELRPGQLDTDSLPPYPVLDAILEAYIEDDKSVDEIANLGYSYELVAKVARMVDRSEYKRRQGPPGVKITAKAFGRDRRIPITNRFTES